MADTKEVHIARLIAIPAVITLGVTVLRVVGELQHWPALFFSTEAGGHAALVGISWLPIIFGPYFAIKLSESGNGPASADKSIGFAFLGLLVFVVGGVLARVGLKYGAALIILGFLIMLAAGFVPFVGWRALGKALLAYAFAARIPVLIVYYLAMSGNGGAGWGTHYDAIPPGAPQLAKLPLLQKFINLAVVPQLTLWIGWTVVLGAICGSIVVAVRQGRSQTAPA